MLFVMLYLIDQSIERFENTSVLLIESCRSFENVWTVHDTSFKKPNHPSNDEQTANDAFPQRPSQSNNALKNAI